MGAAPIRGLLHGGAHERGVVLAGTAGHRSSDYLALVLRSNSLADTDSLSLCLLGRDELAAIFGDFLPPSLHRTRPCAAVMNAGTMRISET